MGCARRGDSFPVCPQKAENHLNELQRWTRAAAISVYPRDGHETLRLLLQPPKSLGASTDHYPHLPSRESVQPATDRVPGSRDSFLGRTHSVPQAGATSRQPLPPQAHPTFRTPPSPGLNEPESPNQPILTPSCLGEEQTPEGNLHAEAGPNPKLNTRSCENKGEKGKSLRAA